MVPDVSFCEVARRLLLCVMRPIGRTAEYWLLVCPHIGHPAGDLRLAELRSIIVCTQCYI
jgi:hypothetical protein